MNYTFFWIIIIIIIIIIILWIIYNSTKKIYVESEIDNNKYLVQNNPDKIKAANILADVNRRITILINYLEKNKNKYLEYKPYINRLENRAASLVLQENGINSHGTSYTINKGDKIVLCIRSKDSNEIHDINLVMYVVLHELAHIACPELNHTDLFRKIFIFFIEISIKLGIYEHTNYVIDPKEYCGMLINENLLNNN